MSPQNVFINLRPKSHLREEATRNFSPTPSWKFIKADFALVTLLVGSLFVFFLSSVHAAPGLAEHKELDDCAIARWYVSAYPMMRSRMDEMYSRGGGTIYKSSENFACFVKNIDGVDNIRIMYGGENDFSLTPPSMFSKVQPVLAKDLWKALEIEPSVYKRFMEMAGVEPLMHTFPCNVVEGYKWLNSNALLKQLIVSHPSSEEAIWSIAGGPVGALGALKFLMDSFALNKGKVADFHLVIMGSLPNYSREFLKVMKIGKRTSYVLPSPEGRWFPVLADCLDEKILNMIKKTAEAVGGYK